MALRREEEGVPDGKVLFFAQFTCLALPQNAQSGMLAVPAQAGHECTTEQKKPDSHTNKCTGSLKTGWETKQMA